MRSNELLRENLNRKIVLGLYKLSFRKLLPKGQKLGTEKVNLGIHSHNLARKFQLKVIYSTTSAITMPAFFKITFQFVHNFIS